MSTRNIIKTLPTALPSTDFTFEQAYWIIDLLRTPLHVGEGGSLEISIATSVAIHVWSAHIKPRGNGKYLYIDVEPELITKSFGKVEIHFDMQIHNTGLNYEVGLGICRCIEISALIIKSN